MYHHKRAANHFSWLVSILFLLPALSASLASASVEMPADWPGQWSLIGRAKFQTLAGSVVVRDGYAVNDRKLKDAEISFRARVPGDAEQVQIWAGFHFRDRDSRYVFALRGGNDNDIYLARYAPDGGSEFLGFAPLDFKPAPGVWYRLRVVAVENHIQIFLNDEKLPRLNVVDRSPLWNGGSVVLGGGWLPAEFSELQIKELTEEEKKAFLAARDKKWAPPPVDKEALRKKERNDYSMARISNSNSPRREISLDGNWLFMPDFQLPAGPTPVQLNYDDEKWHVMPVPSFWTPALSWLHGETGFPDLDEFSSTKGVAESLYVQRIQKCDSYTFDWRKTDAAWYRHYFELSPDVHDRHFELTFGAIAKISKVWVNGIEVGSHTGMFGQVACDITGAVRPGTNVVAVHVVSKPAPDGEYPNKVEGVAVTVEVTSSMLHSLPHGMFQDDVGGIWQPVRLTEMAPVHISDCFIKSGLHDAEINLEVHNGGLRTEKLQIEYSITSVQDGATLYSHAVEQDFMIPAAATNAMKLRTAHLNPQLWSPQDPNLYSLEVKLKSRGEVIDSYKTRFGFRTFAVDGNKFLLNGRPFWLRGANPFPNTLLPNDKAVARRFMQIAREGNVSVTRSHIVPFTETWLDAADEMGMAVSFEGTWPWLMLEGDPPNDKLIQIWRDEFLSLIKEHRNHPSIILWTVNNEMKFEQFDQRNPGRLQRKWKILDETIRAMRETDPTRPIVADSSYVRQETQRGYETLVKPGKLDDGDVDDLHRYYGWYNESFFHLYDGEFNKYTTPGRPLISQEMSTGYPNNDDGHPARFYLFKNDTPQALVGNEAYENADPAIFLTRQALMTKELAETLRRTSHEQAAGVLYFSYFTWFQSPWSVDGLKPWTTYHALKSALQPILVSAELYGRHFYSDTAFHARVCIINDSESCGNIPPHGHLIWKFQDNGRVLSQGRFEAPAVNYYENRWLDVEFKTPRELPAPRVDAKLVLQLESGGKILSENNYDVVIATREWAKGEPDRKTKVLLWSPGKSSLEMPGDLPVTPIDSIEEAGSTNILIVDGLDHATLSALEVRELKNLLGEGGRILMLHPEKRLVDLFPEQVQSYEARDGEIVTMRIPESPVFSGIEPLDMAWFDRGERRLPLACTGIYKTVAGSSEATVLAEQCDLHGYLKTTSEIAKYEGTPLVEIKAGKGCVLASELNLEAGRSDPIARRLLVNMVEYLEDTRAQTGSK